MLFTQHLLHISEADAGRPVYSFLHLTPFLQLFSGVVSQASPVYVMWTGMLAIVWICMESRIAMKHSMMKYSTLFECGPLPPIYILCPSDVIHVISLPHFFHCSSPSMYYTECRRKKNGRGLGMRLRVVWFTIYTIFQSYLPLHLPSPWQSPSPPHPSTSLGPSQ